MTIIPSGRLGSDNQSKWKTYSHSLKGKVCLSDCLTEEDERVHLLIELGLCMDLIV